MLLAGFSVPKTAKPFYIKGYAQGTTYQIIYYAKDSLAGKEEVDRLLDKIDSELSVYKSYSLISQFNNSEAGLEVDSNFQVVVNKSLEVFRESGGLFDITVEPLVQAWGFGATKATSLPDAATIRSILKCVGSEKIHLHHRFLKKDQPCVRIDVNGIAQGYSVDMLARLLEQKGITSYLVELGGEIRVHGPKPNGQPFSIGIEKADRNEFDLAAMQRIIHLNHGGLTTSGNYRKFYQSGNRKISHLINPHTGYPFENTLISATVWAADAITADGYDNVLMGLGLEKSFSFLKRHKEMEAYFIFTRPDGSVGDTATKGFYTFMTNH